MTSETVMVLLLSVFTIGCVVQVQASPVPGGSAYESIAEWIRRVEEKETASEKLIAATQKLLDASLKDVASLKTQGAEERKSLKTLIDQKESHIKALQAKVDKLVANGFFEHNIQDMTWQSLHMAAAASCRAITATGGGGPHTNLVFPRGGGKTCTQVCKASRYEICDGSLSIMGFVGKSSSTTQPVGEFLNYGCDSAGTDGHEPDDKVDIVKYRYHYGYCCCRTAIA